MRPSTDLTQYTDEELEASLAARIPPAPDLSQFSTEELEAALPLDKRFRVVQPPTSHWGVSTAELRQVADPSIPRPQRPSEVRQARRDYINAQISEQVPNFDPEAEWSGGKELDLGYSLDFVQAQRKWRDEHPEGELIQVQTEEGPRILGRTTQDEDFAALPEGWQTLANVLSGRTAGAIAGSVLAPRGYIFPALAVAGLSTLGGSLQYAIERGRGYDDRSATGAFIASLGDGAIDGATEAAIRIALRGIGIRAFDTKAQLADDLRIIRAAERQGFPSVSEGQLGGEYWRGVYAQTAKVSETSTRRIVAVRQEALDNLEKIRTDPNFLASMSDEQVATLVAAYTEDLQRAVFRGARARTPAETGVALQTAIENYRQASRVGVDHLYTVARNMADENTRFNISATQRALNNKLQPVWTRLQQSRGPDGTFEPQALQEISASLGMPRNLIDDLVILRQMDPNVRIVRGPDGSVTDAFEQMTTMRSKFFDAMNDQNASPTARDIARTAWSRLTTDLENIVTGNPQLTEAWRTASTAYRVRANNLESGLVAQLLEREGADSVVRKFFSPGSAPDFAQFATLWRIATPHERRMMSNTVKADFINGEQSASALLRRLDAYENTAPEILSGVRGRDGRMIPGLIPARERATLRDALLARQEFEGSAAFQALTREADRAQRGVQFVRSGTNADFQRYIQAMGGTPGEEALRFSIITDITDHSRVGLERGGVGLDGNLMAERAAYWLGEVRAGRIPRTVFNDDFVQRLTDYQVYGHSMDLASDVGGGMMAGQIRASATRAPSEIITKGTPGVTGLLRKVIQPLYSNSVVNWMLSRNASTWSRIPAEAGVDSAIAGAGMTYASIKRQIEADQRRQDDEITRARRQD